MSQLTTEQILLLENLTYIKNDDPLVSAQNYEGQTVGEWLNSIDTSKLPDYNGDKYTSGEEWTNVINAAKNDPAVANMTIAETYVDHGEGGGGGYSIVFTNDQTNDAVVAFRGTASHEWKDDFVGGGPTDAADGVSTQQQENALNWYKDTYERNGLSNYEVTVTGHSKGGNKAKYITIMDDSVDNCVSFDGQGFSDEFMKEYSDRIADRQSVIHNHNVNEDYVNIILNDVGDKTYYKGYNIGKGGILENHCPNTFMDFDENGNFTMHKTNQSKDMQELDKFMNSYLRSLSSEDNQKALALIGTITEAGFCNASADDLLNIFFDGDYSEDATYLFAFLVVYASENPDFLSSLDHLLEKYELEKFRKYLGYVETIVNSDFLKNHSGTIGSVVLWWYKDDIREYITEEQYKKLQEMLKNANKIIQETDFDVHNGKDITIKSSGKADFMIGTSSIKNCVDEINSQMNSLSSLENRISTMNRDMSNVFDGAVSLVMKTKITALALSLQNEKKKMKMLSESLDSIRQLYDTCESEISNQK